jgi:hypothetical protein
MVVSRTLLEQKYSFGLGTVSVAGSKTMSEVNKKCVKLKIKRLQK